MKSLIVALLVLILAGPRLSVAADSVLLIGGGPTPKDSQVSIESNVIWIAALLEHADFAASSLHFTGGADPGADVHYQTDPEDLSLMQQALTRVFGDVNPEFSVYRHNLVPGHVLRANKKEVVEDLVAKINSLSPDDTLWIIYSGHGGWAEKADKTSLRLWNEERLSATEFSSLLLSAKDGVNIHFILPQCHSGGFIDTLVKQMIKGRGAKVTGANICGFAAVPTELGSEGCTISVNSSDYRDYGGYFFSALSGMTINGTSVVKDVIDFDGDGRISQHEAHLYAVYGSKSADIPRSTSEIYLEAWQPWYLQWMSYGVPEIGSIYSQAARQIADRLHLDGSNLTAAAREAQVQILQLEQQIKSLKALIKAQKSLVEKQQKAVKHLLLMLWPQLNNPYNNDFLVLVSGEEQKKIEAWFAASKEYEHLVENQDLYQQQENDLLTLRREQAAFLRLKRMVYVDRLQAQLARFGSREEQQTYKNLQQCEAWVPPMGRNITH